MKRLIIAITAAAAVLAPTLAGRAMGDTMMSISAVGSGPHGYDWMAGTWACTNPMHPSALGALQSTTFTATKLKDGSVLIKSTSPNGDVSSYDAYVPKTKTWYGPFADSGGKFGTESTRETGKTIRWVGTFYDTDGTATPIRDTYTMLSMTKQYDLSEAQVGGAWKVTAKTTCTKS
ncbi:MAG: hypothetical protein JOY69_03745 [Candidatus Eremiobacteraeota bacterium]|nr:hypothetical protein [Candidatus Eremiobacteraeota bacterium]